MKNEERKSGFVGDAQSRVDKRIYNILKKFSQYEDELGEDACDFTKEEILECHKKSKVSITSVMAINGVLANYTDWCIEHGYRKGDNNYRTITPVDLKRIGEATAIYTIGELINISKQFENPIDRVLILAPFYGFTTKDNCEDYDRLRKGDIDVENGVIKLPSREITAPSEFCSLLIECLSNYKYVFGREGEHYYDLNGDGLIKTKSAELTVNYQNIIAQKYTRNFRAKISDITYSKVTDSGFVYYAKQLVREIEVQDPYDLWEDKRFKPDVLARYRMEGLRRVVYLSKYAPLIFSDEP